MASFYQLFRPFPFEELLWTDVVFGFFLFAFVGWCGECLYAYFVHRRWINRGFLHGPVCPIYGAGAMAVALMLLPIQDQLDTFGLFLFGGLICSVLEFVTSYVMEKIWHLRWWDYSKTKFNFQGRICLGASIVWGILCVLLIKTILPVVFRLFHKIPTVLDLPIALVLIVLLLVDLVFTIISSAKLSRNVETFAELASQLRDETIANYEERMEKWQKLVEEISSKRGQKRLLKAFPSMSSSNFSDALAELRERLNTWRPNWSLSRKKRKAAEAEKEKNEATDETTKAEN